MSDGYWNRDAAKNGSGVEGNNAKAAAGRNNKRGSVNAAWDTSEYLNADYAVKKGDGVSDNNKQAARGKVPPKGGGFGVYYDYDNTAKAGSGVKDNNKQAAQGKPATRGGNGAW